MRIERRHLVDLGQRHFHLGGERGEMRGRQMAVVVLDEMQMLDQKIAPARFVSQQRLHFGERGGVDLTAFGGARWTAAAGCAARNRWLLFLNWRTHGNFSEPPKTA